MPMQLRGETARPLKGMFQQSFSHRAARYDSLTLTATCRHAMTIARARARKQAHGPHTLVQTTEGGEQVRSL